MLHLSLKSLVGTLTEQWHRRQQALAALGAERRCAVSIDALGARLLAMRAKIETLRALIDEAGGEADDADECLRAALAGLKEDIRHVRRQLASMRTAHASARLQRAVDRLGRIAEDTYASADQLQWKIDDVERASAPGAPPNTQARF